MNSLLKPALVLISSILAACAATPQYNAAIDVPTTTGAQAGASSDCNCDQVYRIALLLPLSGQFQSLGHQALNGAMMAFYEQYTPLKVELRPYDTKGTVEGVRTAISQALEDGVNIFVGPVFAKNVQAAAEIITPKGLTLMALSNDKSIAQENVKVLGGHLEAEVDALVQIVLRRNRQSLLLFAPDNAYGNRLRDEFQKLLAPHYEIAFKTVLFPSPPSADDLTQLISLSSGFENRYTHLHDVLKMFREQWQETTDTSQALTQTVDAFDLTERWEDAYPSACIYEDEGDLETDTVLADVIPPLETPQPQEDLADGPGAPETVNIPEEPALLAAYKHTRICERPALEGAEEELAIDQIAMSLEPGAQPEEAEHSPSVPAQEPSNNPTQTEAPMPLAAEEALPEAAATDEMATGNTLEDQIDDALPPNPAEEAAREAELRYEAALQDARFNLLRDFASCMTYLSEKNYEELKGVETIERRFAKREVLGPLRIDTIILPLGNDQLRLASSLFDYYHAGREETLILGTSLWDEAGDLSDELSLRGAKWISNMRPHSARGAIRYKTYFDEKPSYVSALSYDAIMMALNETQKPEAGASPPGDAAFIIGQSGGLRILDDGTNERHVSVKEIAATGEVVSQSLQTFLAKTRFRVPEEDRPVDAQILGDDQYLRRMCVGTR